VVRFRMALTASGVEPSMHDYCRGWILGFLKFIKPRLRVTECARLRIKDVVLGNGYLVVRGGKGDKMCKCGQGLDMVLVVPLAGSLGRSLDENDPAASFKCERRATAGEARGAASKDHKTGYATHAEAFVCYAFARRGRRHTHRARVARTFGCLEPP
jgi:hypothetical protein